MMGSSGWWCGWWGLVGGGVLWVVESRGWWGVVGGGV